MNNYSVYMHKNKLNGKIYIGQTSRSLEERSGPNGLNYSECKRFYSAIKEYGWNNFEHTVLLTGLSPDEANEFERYFIKTTHSYDPDYGYNIDFGGRGFSSERSKKLWNDPTYRQRISEANKEIWSDEEYHKARSALYKEQWKDPEKRKRRSQQAAKRWADEEFHKKASNAVLRACATSVRCVETQEVFDAMIDACKKYNINHANLIRSIRKGCRAGGYHWEYA